MLGDLVQFLTRSPSLEWFLGLPALYFLFVWLFRRLGWFDCIPIKQLHGSEVMAFETVAGLAVGYISVAGLIGWFNVFDVQEVFDFSQNIVYQRCLFAERHIIIPMIIFQSWNTFYCLLTKDFRSWVMISHHLFTVLVSKISLSPFNQYYSLYFFGIIEITSIPLTIIEVFSYFPDLAKRYPRFETINSYVFAGLFFIVRIFFWTIMTYYLWASIFDLIIHQTYHSLLDISLILFGSAFLSILQYFWGYKILVVALSPTNKEDTKVATD